MATLHARTAKWLNLATGSEPAWPVQASPSLAPGPGAAPAHGPVWGGLCRIRLG